jgi:hypothetical protein
MGRHADAAEQERGAFLRVGSTAPSKRSLGRLPKVFAERWEGNREAFEAALRDGLVVPERAVWVAVSLDGVLAPIDGANNATDVGRKAAAEGWGSKWSPGYRERAARRGSSFCDEKGGLLGAIRQARAPDAKVATLKQRLTAETSAILSRRPILKLVRVATARRTAGRICRQTRCRRREGRPLGGGGVVAFVPYMHRPMRGRKLSHVAMVPR